MAKSISRYDSSMDFDGIKQRMQKPLEAKEEKVANIKEKINVSNDYITNIKNINNGINNLRKKVEYINHNNALLQTTHELSSNESIQSATDFMEVDIDNSALLQSTCTISNIKVESVGIKSSIHVRLPSYTAIKYFPKKAETPIKSLEGCISASTFQIYDGKTKLADMPISKKDTCIDLCKKINKNCPRVVATVLNMDFGRLIHIEAKDRSLKNIVCSFNSNVLHTTKLDSTDPESITQIHRVATEGKITINKIERSAKDNYVKNLVPGVHIKLKRENTLDCSQTISLSKGNKVEFEKQLNEVKVTTNVLLEKIANAEEELENAKENNNGARNYEVENLLRDARDAVVNLATSLGGTLKIDSSNNKVAFDETQLENAWKDKDKLQDALLGYIKEKPSAGKHNNGSSLVSLTPGSSTQPVEVKVKIAGNGTVSVKESSAGGNTTVVAAYDLATNTITLRDGTKLLWNKGAATADTRAKFEVRNGTAVQAVDKLDKLEKKAESLKTAQERKSEELEEQKKSLEKKIKEEENKIEMQCAKLEMLQKQFDEQNWFFEQLFAAMIQA